MRAVWSREQLVTLPVLLAVGAVAATAGAVMVSLRSGGGLAQAVPGLPQAGPWAARGLAASQAAQDGAAVVTVSVLLAVAFLPSQARQFGLRRLQALLAAALAALAWAGACLAGLVFTAADLLARPVNEVWDPALLAHVAVNSPQGRALAVTGAWALGLATVLPAVDTVRSARFALAAALAGVLPPVFAGHVASTGSHRIAVLNLAVHVLAATAWTAGLVAVAVTAMHAPQHAAAAVERFSALAAWSLVAVAGTGMVSASLLLSGPAQLVTTGYGLLLVDKATLLLVFAVAGNWLRHRALLRLKAGRRKALMRLAAGELLVLCAAIGLSVGLSRSPAPAVERLPNDRVRELGREIPVHLVERPAPIMKPALRRDAAPQRSWVPAPAATALVLSAAGPQEVPACGGPHARPHAALPAPLVHLTVTARGRSSNATSAVPHIPSPPRPASQNGDPT